MEAQQHVFISERYFMEYSINDRAKQSYIRVGSSRYQVYCIGGKLRQVGGWCFRKYPVAIIFLNAYVVVPLLVLRLFVVSEG